MRTDDLFDKRAADWLAYEVGRLVAIGSLDARSGAADALLNYLKIGSPDGPESVPAWMERYKAINRQ